MTQCIEKCKQGRIYEFFFVTERREAATTTRKLRFGVEAEGW